MTRLASRFGATNHVRRDRPFTRASKGIDGDVKLNRALWVMAENMLQLAS